MSRRLIALCPQYDSVACLLAGLQYSTLTLVKPLHHAKRLSAKYTTPRGDTVKPNEFILESCSNHLMSPASKIFFFSQKSKKKRYKLSNFLF